MGWIKKAMEEQVEWLAGSTDKRLTWFYEEGAIEGYGPGELKFNGLARARRKGTPTKRYLVRESEKIEIVDQSNGLSLGGAVGWGTAGALIAGPAGGVVGGLLGGQGQQITFTARFSDGDTMMGRVTKKTWVKMLADRF